MPPTKSRCLSKGDWEFLLNAMKTKGPLPKMIYLPESKKQFKLARRSDALVCVSKGDTPEDFHKNPFQLTYRSRDITKWFLPYSGTDLPVKDRIFRIGTVATIENLSKRQIPYKSSFGVDRSSALAVACGKWLYCQGPFYKQVFLKMIEWHGGKESATAKFRAAVNARRNYNKALLDQNDEGECRRTKRALIKCIKTLGFKSLGEWESFLPPDPEQVVSTNNVQDDTNEGDSDDDGADNSGEIDDSSGIEEEVEGDSDGDAADSSWEIDDSSSIDDEDDDGEESAMQSKPRELEKFAKRKVGSSGADSPVCVIPSFRKDHTMREYTLLPSEMSPRKKRRQGRQLTIRTASLKRSAKETSHSDPPPLVKRHRTIQKAGKQQFGLSRTATEDEPRANPFRGLRNLGNTCFMNASLQMLCTLEDTVREIKKVAQARGGDLTNSVVDIAEQLGIEPSEATDGSAVNPKVVKDAMDKKTKLFEGFEQRDAHEFLSNLVDKIHEELALGDDKQAAPQGEHQKDTRKGSPMDVFLLTVQKCLTCQTCGYSRSEEETYRHLSINIVTEEARGASLDKSLAHFFQPEVREVKCEKCEHGTHASQTMKVLHRPKALLLHLKRFVVVEKPVPKDPEATSEGKKVEVEKSKAHVGIAESLSLDSFHAEGLQADSSAYKLKGVVHHTGQRASSGHYTADVVRLVEKNDQSPSQSESIAVAEAEPTASMMDAKTRTESGWVSFDDGISSLTTLEKITGDREKQLSAYMVLYILEEGTATAVTTVAQASSTASAPNHAAESHEKENEESLAHRFAPHTKEEGELDKTLSDVSSLEKGSLEAEGSLPRVHALRKEVKDQERVVQDQELFVQHQERVLQDQKRVLHGIREELCVEEEKEKQINRLLEEMRKKEEEMRQKEEERIALEKQLAALLG